MSNANLYALFLAHFPTDPDAVFLDAPNGHTLRYADIPQHTGRMLTRLRQAGVGKGDRVVVQIDKSIEAVVLYLACLRAGAIYVPLNTAYTASEVTYFLQDAEPRLFICTPSARTELAAIAEETGVARVFSLGADAEGDLVDALSSVPVSDEIALIEGNDLAAILYTSGTTGRSKGAMLSHANLAANARTLHDCWRWQSADVLLHALPIFHVHGLFVALHCALLGGSRVVFLPRFDLPAVIGGLGSATVMMGVPTFYTRLLGSKDLSRSLVSGIRLFISGSAPLLAETHRGFEARTGHRILERYGMTETGMITSNPCDGERIAGTVGFALPGVSVRVADEQGRVLEAGETGVLEVTGPNVSQGYWRMPDKTAAEFREDGWFITGDLAIMDRVGRVTIVGRARDLVISGGFNVYPSEVESRIDALPGVKESAVIGVPHPDLGDGVTAVVVADGTVDLTEAAVIEGLAGCLARFKQPKRVFIVDELPRNTMGKVQKNQLRDSYRDTYS